MGAAAARPQVGQYAPGDFHKSDSKSWSPSRSARSRRVKLGDRGNLVASRSAHKGRLSSSDYSVSQSADHNAQWSRSGSSIEARRQSVHQGSRVYSLDEGSQYAIGLERG
jgi:hypothetical protein